MTTSATQDFLSDVLVSERIPTGKLAYFETRFASLMHQAMLKVFGKLEREKNFTRRQLARRIGRKPEQITRWFSYPGNLTLSTISDIFLGTGFEIHAVILSDLATGVRYQFPEPPAIPTSAIESLLGQRTIVVERPTRLPQSIPGATLAADAAGAAFVRSSLGRAASDQDIPRAPRAFGEALQ